MLPAGTVIDGKYEIVNTLGSGGFGAVYAAIQKQFDRKVAVKMLNTTLLMEPDGQARFEREAKAINALKHKNIVAVYGYGIWQQAPYMVMEFVEGKSIDSIIQDNGKMEPKRSLHLIHQVYEALSHAHKSGVVHRDLKPSNVMVAADADGAEYAKIIDFGLAKLMPGYGIPGQKLTETGYALGTCHYMAPEQALGVPVDGRADIYAAGCILYEMLTANKPFEGEENVAIMYRHLNDTPAPVSKFVGGSLAAPLTVLLNNCMAKSRDLRYATCEDVLKDINAVLDGQFAAVKPIAGRQMQGLRHKERTGPQTLWIALGFSATAFLIAIALYVWTNHHSQAIPERVLNGMPPTEDEAKRSKQIVDSEHALPPAVQLRLLKAVCFNLASKIRKLDDWQAGNLNFELSRYLSRTFNLRREEGPNTYFSDEEILRDIEPMSLQWRLRLLYDFRHSKDIHLSPKDEDEGSLMNAVAWRESRRFDKAMPIAQTVAQEGRSPSARERGALIAANIAILMGNYDIAQNWLNKVLYTRDGLLTDNENTLSSAARLALCKHDYEKALKYAKQAEAVVKQENVAEISASGRVLHVAAVSRMGQKDSAKKLARELRTGARFRSQYAPDILKFDSGLTNDEIDAEALLRYQRNHFGDKP